VGTAELIGRLLLALCFVLGLRWMVGHWAKIRGRGRKGTTVMTVLARQQLSRNSSVALVQVLDRAIMLGVTDGHVSMLGDADLAELELRLAPPVRGPRRMAGAPVAPIAPVASVAPGIAPGAHGIALPIAAFAGVSGVAGASGAAAPSPAGAGRSPLAGSALSLATWRLAIDSLRERTVRR
jgi:flagellar protein FliO/FliZ